MKTQPFLPPPRNEVIIIPSWSGARRKRQFLRIMDKVYWSILKLGDFVEEPTTEYCDTTPQDYQKENKCKILIPPLSSENKVDTVGRLFGGTVRTKILKLDDKVTVERNCEENSKSMKIFPRPKMYKNVSILSIVKGLEENLMTVGDEELDC